LGSESRCAYKIAPLGRGAGGEGENYDFQGGFGLKPSHSLLQGITETIEATTDLWSEGRRQKLPLYLFLALCFNLVLAPIVYAASGNEFSRTQAWALGVLGLGTVALSVYLLFVMFVPEKF